jgi:phosphoglycerate-specific signal transduction histidine kinase
MEEIHELADILAKHRGCSWLRQMLARPCYDARLVLHKVQQKKKGLRSSKRCKEMEQRKWEENERKKIERNLKAGWQGEPI